MRSVRQIPAFANIPILVRTPLNVPIENGAVADDYRLKKALPTITFLAEHGAKVVLASHLGEKGTETLAPVAEALARFVPRTSFCPESTGPAARDAVRALSGGSVLVLENLRRNPGEVANDPAFAKELALLADVFVQDSFDTCHRKHASIVALPALLPAYAGLLLEEEVSELSEALSPQHPALAVIGGAKFETKETVLETLLARYDHVFVGGALANDFLKAEGREIGASLASPAADPAKLGELLANPKLALPVDVRALPAAAAADLDARAKARVARADGVRADETILDAGPATEALLADLAGKARTILWNGPLGRYEAGFIDATDSLARAVAASGARSIVGGGDTVASIENLGLIPRFSFVSTGGGAMLDFLAEGTLPGLAALNTTGL
ncbi:MAG: phosphoglycerate kinase [Patescibacteria group bacterium]|nr:phosphoglycerate kinase [Patescibacteria group bacterium]MDE1944486.1 phosphoglycerate kinase [Patescibacteria group bacterium]MDE1944741.1 phosphoglycerate kinase [Patescibacteria group bacterium]MDE2057285.1 phosphoglycerate kinase [Patescibacteria group bacterium]